MPKKSRRGSKSYPRRSEPSLERAAGNKPVGQTILIVCQGTNTEPSYFRNFRLSFVTIKIKAKAFDPLRLVEWAEEQSVEDVYDQVWCVFDKDDFQEFDNAISKAASLNFGVAYSNQAFEYWLILHFNDHQGGPIDRKTYNKLINDYLEKFKVRYDGNDSKTITSDFFNVLNANNRVDLAIKRAKKILEQHESKNNHPSKAESSTTVFKLVEELLKYQN